MTTETDLSSALDRLGFGQYAAMFEQQGFETWEQFLDITEDDMIALNVVVGHRRRLLRAIHDAGHISIVPVKPQQNSPTEQLQVVPQHLISTQDHGHDKTRPPIAAPSQHAHNKRKYRRHPKPDDNAPVRPQSAYVLFSNRIRDRLSGQDLSFTQIAKIVGEHWQDPDPEERSACEREAQRNKDVYYSELQQYKKTPEWAAYQRYLAEFKAKQAEKSASGSKRPKSRDNREVQTQRDGRDQDTDGAPSNASQSDNSMDTFSPSNQSASVSSYTQAGQNVARNQYMHGEFSMLTGQTPIGARKSRSPPGSHFSSSHGGGVPGSDPSAQPPTAVLPGQSHWEWTPAVRWENYTARWQNPNSQDTHDPPEQT
ncbi:High mobility group protein 20A [Sphaceloma murrayae]|uniref:High mobility group protein 20A n=1 Tax=Sphaceloma murrayae TaxID=2082308 RepID=A0A2K1QRN2_9PEZI|nr:High mobility group protein 20A [Sphaceloma murrayae]